MTDDELIPSAPAAAPHGTATIEHDDEFDDEAEYEEEEDAPNVLDDWVVYPSMLIGILVTTVLPILLGQRFCLPILSGLVIVPMFAWALRQGRPRKAIELGLFWAVAQSLTLIIATVLLPSQAASAVLGGLEYRNEWLQWVTNGTAIERAPATAILQQAKELLIYAAATFLTGGIAGLFLLTVDMDAFNFSVASELPQAAQPVLLALAGWPVWMFVRLAGYLTVGAVLAEPIMALNFEAANWSAWWRRRRRLLAIGLGLILLALLLQLVLTPLYRSLLQSALGLTQ